jgi:hypothetical protein
MENNFRELALDDKVTDFNEKFKEFASQNISAQLKQEYSTNISNILKPSEE